MTERVPNFNDIAREKTAPGALVWREEGRGARARGAWAKRPALSRVFAAWVVEEEERGIPAQAAREHERTRKPTQKPQINKSLPKAQHEKQEQQKNTVKKARRPFVEMNTIVGTL